MALPHCPQCNSTQTQANVSTLNCLSCGCVFDFAAQVVDQPEQGVPDPPESEPVVADPAPVEEAEPEDDDEPDDEPEAAEKPKRKLLSR